MPEVSGLSRRLGDRAVPWRFAVIEADMSALHGARSVRCVGMTGSMVLRPERMSCLGGCSRRFDPGSGPPRGHQIALRGPSRMTALRVGDRHGRRAGHAWPPICGWPTVAVAPDTPWRSPSVFTGVVGWAGPRASSGWLPRAKPAHQTACNRPAASVGGTGRPAPWTGPRRDIRRPRRRPRVPRPRNGKPRIQRFAVQR